MNLGVDENISSERRRNVLSNDDIDRIGDMFSQKMDSLFETIGYDVSNHDSRSNIRKDHEFVRWLRRAKGKLLGAFWAGIGGSCALWFWNAVQAGQIAHPPAPPPVIKEITE